LAGFSNVKSGDVRDRKLSSLGSRILNDGLVPGVGTVGASVFKNTVLCGSLCRKFSSVGSLELQSLVVVAAIVVSNRVAAMIGNLLASICRQKTEERDLRLVVGTIDNVFFGFVVESVSILHISEIHVSRDRSSVMSSVVDFSVCGVDTCFESVEVAEDFDGIGLTSRIRIDPVPAGSQRLTGVL